MSIATSLLPTPVNSSCSGIVTFVHIQLFKHSERSIALDPRQKRVHITVRLAQEVIQEISTPTSSQVGKSTRGQRSRSSAVLRAGNTTGVRSSGRKIQPSIRRTRSQWELAESDEDSSCIIVKQ